MQDSCDTVFFCRFALVLPDRHRRSRRYSPLAGTAPTSRIGAVGVFEPAASSTVTPKAFALTPAGIDGSTTDPFPAASGRNNPAGIGADPFAGITHSS